MSEWKEVKFSYKIGKSGEVYLDYSNLPTIVKDSFNFDSRFCKLVENFVKEIEKRLS